MTKFVKKGETGKEAFSEQKLLTEFLKLPKKVLHYHDVANLAQLILHEIGHHSRLNLRKAAFLVDNPDFDCLQGVAGFCSSECQLHGEDLWHEPHAFCDHMKKAAFHNKLKQISKQSLYRASADTEQLKELGKELGIENPDIYVWEMKRNDNHGVFIFEEGDRPLCRKIDGLLDQISALLELCPIR